MPCSEHSLRIQGRDQLVVFSDAAILTKLTDLINWGTCYHTLS